MYDQQDRRSHQRPSPLALSQIIARFGRRVGPARSLAGFLLCGCRAMAHPPGDSVSAVEIDIRALGFSEIHFTGDGPFHEETMLVIVLRCGRIGPQRWCCKVIRSEPCAESSRHVVARFLRPTRGTADVAGARTTGHG